MTEKPDRVLPTRKVINMRCFDYFLFDNYCPDKVNSEEDDPRIVLNESANGILTEVIQNNPGNCLYNSICALYTKPLVDRLIHIGLLKKDGSAVLLDAPVIVNEDLNCLNSVFFDSVSNMADIIIQNKKAFYNLVSQLNNGFSPEINLYHVLCGSIFDGSFFDYLSSCNVVSTSRVHNSGLDYLIIVYEKTPELALFSKHLLCSYNRFTDGKRTLQSFGDSDGNRTDAFRFMCLSQLGNVPDNLMKAQTLWDKIGQEKIKETLLSETENFLETGKCHETCLELLTIFGYIKEGKIAVPVYRKEHLPVIKCLEELTESCIFHEMNKILNSPDTISELLCSKHVVRHKEISNELYHIIFGKLNEILVSQGFVCAPEMIPGEGRYLKSIEIY